MSSKLEQLKTSLEQGLAQSLVSATLDRGQITVVLKAENIVESALVLRDRFGFEQCIDLCGVDYSAYKNGCWDQQRFAVVCQLLSVGHNQRLRIRYFAEDDEFPVVPSLIDVWSSVNWFEREAFDLYGIMFEGHPDLRRILTDYGFVGHPFRKDFPLSGNVEMRYDPAQGRVIYQPVTIEPREITPRIVREENYGG